MDASTIRLFAWFAAIALVVAVALSMLFSVPYIFTAAGFAGWLFVGQLVTIDDDFPGGWSNPDGIHPIPWAPLALKGLIFLALLLAAGSPAIRQWGG
ncbi:MAG: hypothetical protein JNJ73_08635 [Hyphomonadaceae bacterium]|nr:hypothetical protein [Hyphomonadaceae bacterium]